MAPTTDDPVQYPYETTINGFVTYSDNKKNTDNSFYNETKIEEIPSLDTFLSGLAVLSLISNYSKYLELFKKPTTKKTYEEFVTTLMGKSYNLSKPLSLFVKDSTAD